MNTWVVGPDMPCGGRAILAWKENPGWSTFIPCSEWIWDSYKISNPEINQTCYFTQKFNIPGQPTEGTLAISVDDVGEVFINQRNTNFSFDRTWGKAKEFKITEWLNPGLNTFTVMATNIGEKGKRFHDNPGGVKYLILVKYRIRL